MIEFTDAELHLILTMASKADPMEMVMDIQGIRRKILAYAQEKQQEQMAQAAQAAAQEPEAGG